MNKAKRKITEFNFEEEGAHVALVDKAANEQSVLVMKSKYASEQEIKKLAEVTLKLPLLEYLTRYLWMDIDDAEVIAGMMGYSYEDLYSDDKVESVDYFREMVENNLGKVNVSKSLSNESVEQFKKNFSKFKEVFQKDSQSSAASQDEDVVKAEDQKTTVEKNEENSMTQETEVQKSELEIELEKAKAQLADLEKAQEEKVALEKSLKEMSETVTVLKAAEEKRKEAEYLEKAKQHAMVLTDDLLAADLAKALRLAEETEGCAALVKAFEAYRDVAAKSDALEEIGKSVADDRTVGTKLDMAIEKAMKDHGVDYMKALDVVQKESPELFAEEYKA